MGQSRIPRHSSRTHSVRTAARALIIRDGCLLATAMRNDDGPFYLLPGGGQCSGETLPQTILRECREELGCLVIVRELLFVREYIGRNHRFSRQHHSFHQVEAVFRCELEEGAEVLLKRRHDALQEGVHWLPLDRLDEFPFYPRGIKSLFQDGDIRVGSLYLGDIN